MLLLPPAPFSPKLNSSRSILEQVRTKELILLSWHCEANLTFCRSLFAVGRFDGWRNGAFQLNQHTIIPVLILLWSLEPPELSKCLNNPDRGNEAISEFTNEILTDAGVGAEVVMN